MTDPKTPPLLQVEDLRVSFGAGAHETRAVDGIGLTVERGRTHGIVGESGSGKSMLSLAIMGLVPDSGRIASGRIRLGGRDLAGLPYREMQAIRGKRIAMIFQEPMTSLNPLYTIGRQLSEAIRAHDRRASAREIRNRAIELLRRVRIPSPERRVDDYPHQMSGGMRQRVMIAMALSCGPELLIADEPTTALDVTVQVQILDLLRELQDETGMAMIFITHDLGVVAAVADEVSVMYAGRVVETGTARNIFEDAQHPYTLGLLGSRPRLDRNLHRLPTIEGAVPPPFDLPPGCRFEPRCAFATPDCAAACPGLRPFGGNHLAACFRAPVKEIAR
ncbi:ABC transporter ATP-binding protein [Salipiger sp. P9]|uniref:ABC transporter ATP-binding protein n=1 Tax=Salipiger pentaromativorans TaxID=2943193 RepID=UPI002157EED1|nr:ABC transporter ATP-binding protein [Salipiger pentaromativorans]MCR8549235.1 ABC transporter ATP-binding protein [Salipiger pentaromativorans]